MKFIRYGGLSSVVQKGYDAHAEEFHSPPARRGIYAFIWPYIEWFLLSGYEMDPWKANAKFEWVRDRKGNRIPVNESTFCEDPVYDKLYDDYLNAKDEKRSGEAARLQKELGIPSNAPRQAWCPKDEKWYYTRMKKRREFTVSDNTEVWHHLSDHVSECDVIARKGTWILTSVSDLVSALEKEKHKSRVDHASFAHVSHTYKDIRPFKNSVRDHLEVFFEKV